MEKSEKCPHCGGNKKIHVSLFGNYKKHWWETSYFSRLENKVISCEELNEKYVHYDIQSVFCEKCGTIFLENSIPQFNDFLKLQNNQNIWE